MKALFNAVVKTFDFVTGRKDGEWMSFSYVNENGDVEKFDVSHLRLKETEENCISNLVKLNNFVRTPEAQKYRIYGSGYRTIADKIFQDEIAKATIIDDEGFEYWMDLTKTPFIFKTIDEVNTFIQNAAYNQYPQVFK